VAAGGRAAPMKSLAAIAFAALLTCTTAGAGDDPDEPERVSTGPLTLTPAQQLAVGVQVEHPLPLRSPVEIEAFGTVVDPVKLVTDLGRVESTRAAQQAASADAARLEHLYHDEARASLKSVQAAQAQATEAQAQAQTAALSFRLDWGPLASSSVAARRTLGEAFGAGRQLLLRAAVPGYRAGGVIGPRALVEVDGANVVARVLGPLPRIEAQPQSAGWLLAIEHRPEGLAPGAHAAVHLQTASVAGLLVPAAALVYAPEGVFVYRQQRAPDGVGLRYAAAAVKPVARVGRAWLVTGLERSDAIVVQGAGVLWSLQGIGSFSAAEEDHD
jgi:hypothetical protein